MGIIHLIYVKPGFRSSFQSGIPRAVELRARSALDKLLSPQYRIGGAPAGFNPLPAPFSITVNLYRYLRERRGTWLYNYFERGMIRLGEGDILLGHPHPDPSTLVQQTFQQPHRGRCRALIFPLHHGIPSINEYALGVLEQADIVFGIMGPYWYDTLDTSFLAPWKKKIIPLDMAVDGSHYPFVKRQFNPPGQRGYLYIGGNHPEKGCDILAQTMSRLEEFPKGWIGGGPDIPHMPRIATHAELRPDYVSNLANRYDVFVNTSISDANPTTILEAMAWGFPVACTPQSGYYNMPSLISLSLTDIAGNVEALLRVQHAPEEELMELSKANRMMVERHYTWERFCDTVWQSLEAYV